MELKTVQATPRRANLVVSGAGISGASLQGDLAKQPR